METIETIGDNFDLYAEYVHHFGAYRFYFWKNREYSVTLHNRTNAQNIKLWNSRT